MKMCLNFKGKFVNCKGNGNYDLFDLLGFTSMKLMKNTLLTLTLVIYGLFFTTEALVALFYFESSWSWLFFVLQHNK